MIEKRDNGYRQYMNKVVVVLSVSIVLLKALNCQLLSHLTCSGIWSASLLNGLKTPKSLAANQRFLLFYLFPRLHATHHPVVPHHTKLIVKYKCPIAQSASIVRTIVLLSESPM